ncbi:MAG: response regulator [Proteobacteria bacterium]|nr:response regulator [Pseudomonadota bacterium]
MTAVLIVEDEIHIQRLTKLILEKAGFEVTAASSGEEAMAAIENVSKKFDLVLLDIMMKGVDGLQVLKVIRQNQKYTSLPVVMLTAIAQEAVVLKGIQLGARDYIRKPFHPKDLLDRIKRLLDPRMAKN